MLTHGHNDHINAAVPLRDAVDAPVLLHDADQMLWDVVWPDDQPDGAVIARRVLKAGGHELGVLHTPGHSPGAAASTTSPSGVVFSGDTLFCGGPGATGRSHSDEPTIVRSIRDVLLALPDQTIVHTGHGDSTTIGAERRRRPRPRRRTRPLAPSGVWRRPGTPGTLHRTCRNANEERARARTSPRSLNC